MLSPLLHYIPIRVFLAACSPHEVPLRLWLCAQEDQVVQLPIIVSSSAIDKQTSRAHETCHCCTERIMGEPQSRARAFGCSAHP